MKQENRMGHEFLSFEIEAQSLDRIERQERLVKQWANQQQRIICQWIEQQQAMIHLWAENQDETAKECQNLVNSMEHHAEVTNRASMGLTAVLCVSLLILSAALIINIMMPYKYTIQPTPKYKELEDEITRPRIRKELKITPPEPRDAQRSVIE